MEWWCDKVGPRLDFKKVPLMGSIFGDKTELIQSARMLNEFKFVGLKVNPSCPNTGHALHSTVDVIASVKAVKKFSCFPIIVKVSVAQDYLAIARGLEGVAEAIAINSVPWEMVFPGKRSPLWRLEKRVGGGGGGVSGKPAQELVWKAVEQLAKQGSLPVIAPSIMEFEDIDRTRKLGARAFSYGAIHLRTPWRPTSIVRKVNS